MGKDVVELVKIADKLDEMGISIGADLLDKYISKVARKGYHKNGLKEETVETHRELLKDYRGAMESLQKAYLKQVKGNGKYDNPNSSELRSTLRDISHNENGAYLHEMYFADLYDSRPFDLERTKTLYPYLKDNFEGNHSKLLESIKRLSKLTRNGWVIIGLCIETKRLYLNIIDQHEVGMIASNIPIAVFDLWEHAYMVDFGNDKDAYLDWCFERFDWRGADKRLKNLLRLK